jgi:hypothetical protein
LSSTTDTRSERGQILVIFAGSLLVLFGIAALVFDGGLMLLEKRDQQNAADAAAIAGARFLPTSQAAAEAEAREVATLNGFTDGVNDQLVFVTFPSSGRIAVRIEDVTPSFFAGIWGIFEHDVASRAVAVNEDRALGPFGILTLEDHDCSALFVSGGGQISSNGDIQVNSDCPSSAMRLQGTGEVVVAPSVACNIVGGYQEGGASSNNCPINEGAVPIPDPFLGMIPYEPPIPADGSGTIIYPIPPVQVTGSPEDIPDGCPGSAAPATHASPDLCRFHVSGTSWRLFPGYYPGGLHFQSGLFYLEPGIYYIGGGGLAMNATGASLRSVAPGGTTLGGGVLIYNGDHPTEGEGDVTLNGGSAGVQLLPMQTGTYAGMAIYQDAAICETVTLNGSSSAMTVRGVIYVPCGLMRANGNGGTIVTDQIVSQTFQFNGAGGSLQVLFDDSFLPTLSLAGLIE